MSANSSVKVSVIVPMYNVETYLETCLNSLAAQTLGSGLEVILVNDGSTDHTLQIAQRFAEKFPDRFTLVSKANGGLSDARNFGLSYVHGPWLCFLDSDDWAEPWLYEKLVQRMEETGADIGLTDLEYWYQDPAQCFVMKGLSAWAADTVNKKALLSPMFAWNKIYRSSLFLGEKGVRYPVGTWYEDLPVSTLLLAQAGDIAYLPVCGLHYRQRGDSIMGSTRDPRVHDIFGVLASVRREFHEACLYETYEKELEYLHIEHLRLYGMFRFIRSPYWKTCYEESERVMQDCFPHWRRNPYLKNLSVKNRLFLNCYNRADAPLANRLVIRTGR